MSDDLASVHTLMVQGTTSDAGKSVLVAGLGRVLMRHGFSVAPFKPQNMALNSAVTCDGGEIGRAQAVQAQACGVLPHTDMNPVLLKPSSDTGAQVIVHGKALSNMEAGAFHHYKKVAMKAVLESYQRLQKKYQYIVVEGAGSPAEINLRENDIANMGFAEAVDCPVIIVADIDRGGVFAHLVGTLALLSESEQQRVVGFVINRFRGDIALLQSGLDWLEEKTQKPVLGVVPYLENFYVDAEDAIAVTQHSQQVQDSPTPQSTITIVIPVFSRISNHTDFDALQLHPQVNVIFVGPQQIFPEADVIILPGTKNVRKDLALLREYGWDKMILRHLRYGGKVIGICGGYQMLGETISDPLGIEGDVGSSSGLGLFHLQTELRAHKQLQQVTGHLWLDHLLPEHVGPDNTNPSSSRVAITAYEIHCGVSAGTENYTPLFVIDSDTVTPYSEGVIHPDGNIIGTYCHGLFDQPEVTTAFLAWAGLHHANDHAVDIDEVREQQLNRLADCLEDCLALDKLFPVLLNRASASSSLALSLRKK